MNDKVELFERLQEIREEMAELIHETENLMRTDFKHEYHNAEVYWIAHIKSALGDMGYPTYSTTFFSALESIEGEVYEDDEEEYEED